MKQTQALDGLGIYARRIDNGKHEAGIGLAGSVLYAWHAKNASATDEAIGEAITTAGAASLKRAQAGKYALIGAPIHNELQGSGVDHTDPVARDAYLGEVAPEVRRLITAMEKVIRQGGKGARDAVRDAVAPCASVSAAVDALESLIEDDDPAAVLLAEIASRVATFVDAGYVPGDLDLMASIMSGVRTMEGRC